MNSLKETSPLVHTGLDIAKATLQLDLLGRAHTLPNTAAGHRQLVKLLRAVPGAHVVCEATGGYERAVVAALHAEQIPVSVLNPALVRHFALAQGQRAKNDPLDAGVLTAYGAALRPAATPRPDAALDFVQKRLGKLAAHLDQQRAAVETELAAALARAPQWQEPVARLEALDGVGRLTAVSVLSQMPELGRLNRGEAAALAGLAPWTRQSGPWEGQRHIGGGRAAVRRALYMSAVALARMKGSTLGKFYAKLRAAGKPAKVALTAVMRKLLVQMNHELKPA
ncbi:MAG: transposase [Phycisphaerales bacterium]|jgi:transposase